MRLIADAAPYHKASPPYTYHLLSLLYRCKSLLGIQVEVDVTAAGSTGSRPSAHPCVSITGKRYICRGSPFVRTNRVLGLKKSIRVLGQVLGYVGNQASKATRSATTMTVEGDYCCAEWGPGWVEASHQ